jgi:hypothetical protein
VVVTTATAKTSTVYNSIPKPLPGNVTSEGPEAYAFAELGDGLGLTATGTISQVTVIMSSWACQSGSWTDNYPNGTTGNICVTATGATFSQAITVNIYSVTDAFSTVYGTNEPTPLALLATTTQTFNIPYRPSSTPAQCGNDPQRWYNSKDKTCYHGLAAPISVNFSGSHVAIPVDHRVIVTVAFNTTSAV